MLGRNRFFLVPQYFVRSGIANWLTPSEAKLYQRLLHNCEHVSNRELTYSDQELSGLIGTRPRTLHDDRLILEALGLVSFKWVNGKKHVYTVLDIETGAPYPGHSRTKDKEAIQLATEETLKQRQSKIDKLMSMDRKAICQAQRKNHRKERQNSPTEETGSMRGVRTGRPPDVLAELVGKSGSAVDYASRLKLATSEGDTGFDFGHNSEPKLRSPTLNF